MSLMTILASFVTFGTACSQEGSDSGPDTEMRGLAGGDLAELEPARSGFEGTPEGVGLIAFLNSETTTFELLDITVGLDRRAAGNLIAHRDGGDRKWGSTDDDVFNTVDEVDAVRYVGPASIDRMVVYASKVGFVPGGQDLLGVYDGVAFTVEQAQATLALANLLSQDELDYEMALHSIAAESIAIAQPIESVDELSRLYYVGASALSRLKDVAETTEINQQN